VSEIEVISFHPTTEPLFRVVYSPRGKRRKELMVVGVVLTKIQALDCLSPIKGYRLEPVFLFGADLVLGQSFWDPAKDGGDITVTPIKRRNKARKSCSTEGATFAPPVGNGLFSC
jgi:hypothetical protein